MPAPKGTRPPNAGKGRAVGSQNKVTSDVKAMILGALNKAGGEEYLFKQAVQSPAAFLTLIGKVLPTQLTGLNDGAMELKVTMTPAAVRKEIDEAFREVKAERDAKPDAGIVVEEGSG